MQMHAVSLQLHENLQATDAASNRYNIIKYEYYDSTSVTIDNSLAIIVLKIVHNQAT